MNRLKTAMLLAALTALLLWLGQSVGGRQGMIFALVMAGVMNIGSYWFSDKIVLQMYRAQPIDESTNPEIISIVSDLAQMMKIPMPRVYMIPQEAPNAFATGRNPQHAAVAVTEGIMRLLNRDELQAVLGHELGHVIHRDTLISTVAATMAGALSYLGNMALWGMSYRGRSDDNNRGGNPLALVGIILAPIAAALIQMAISRSREFLADETGAEVSGKPLALASALQKLEGWKQQLPVLQGSPATAHMFIINPFTAERVARLFSTHPSTEERIARLEKMAAAGPKVHFN